MAAIGRLSRLAVSLTSKARFISARCPKPAAVISQADKMRTGTACIPRFISRHCTSYAGDFGTRSPGEGVGSEQGRFRNKNPRQVASNDLGEAVFRMEGQVRRFGRADPDAFEECLKLLKNTAVVSSMDIQILIRSVGKIVKMTAQDRCAGFNALWSELCNKGVTFDLSHYNAALQVRAENEESFDPTEYLAEIESKGLSPNKVTYQLAIDTYCERGDLTGAQKFLEVIKEKDMPIGRVVFDSLIKGHMKTGDVEGARGMLDHMTEAGLEPNGDTYKVLLCGHAEQGNMEAVRQTLEEAKREYIMAQECQLFSLVYSLAHSGNGQHVDEVLKVIKHESELYNNDGRNCMFRLVKTGHTEEAYKVFKCLHASSRGQLKPTILLRPLISSGLPFEEMKSLIERMSTEGLLTERAGSLINWARRIYSAEGMSVRDGDFSNNMLTGSSAQGKSIEDLEEQRSSLLAQNQDTTQVDSFLLFKYATQGLTEKAEELKAVLDSGGFLYTASLLRQLASMEARNSNLDKALEYKNKMTQTNPEYTDYSLLVVQIANLQLREGKHEDALNTLSVYSSHPHLQGELPQIEFVSSLCHRLVESSLETCTPEETQEMVDTLYNLGYIRRADSSFLGYIVKAYMDKNDGDGVISALEYCSSKYGRSAKQRQVLRKFIQEEDATRLQKVVDLLSRHQDEAEVLTRLAFRFIECDKVKQARKLFQTIGRKMRMPAVIQETDIWVTQGMVSEMLRFVEGSKDMFGFDRDRVLLQLIKVHATNHDHQRALDVLQYYEEEGLTPRSRTLQFLSEFLKQENKPVPFDVPDSQPVGASEGSAESLPQSSPSTSPRASQPISVSSNPNRPNNTYNLEQVSQELKRTHERKERVASKLLPSLANCSVEDLAYIQDTAFDKSDTSNSKARMMVASYTFRAYVKSGRFEDIFQRLLEDPDLLELSMTSGNISIVLEHHPEVIPKLEEAILKQSLNRRIPLALYSLFNSYVSKGRFTDANILIEKRPELRATKSLTGSCREAEQRQDEAHLQRMMEEFKDWPNAGIRAAFISAIRLCCRREDSQGALAYLEKAQQRGITLQDLSIVLSQYLEPLLLSKSQTLPWPPGSLGERVPRQDRNSNREEFHSF